jgi:hypothetical protein
MIPIFTIYTAEIICDPEIFEYYHILKYWFCTCVTMAIWQYGNMAIWPVIIIVNAMPIIIWLCRKKLSKTTKSI